MSIQIELNFEEYPDLELLEKGFHLQLSRIFINIIFRTEKGWTEVRPAIIDTGSPISVLPKDIWNICQHKIFTKTRIYGMVPKKEAFIPAYYGEIKCAFLDNKNVSNEYQYRAFLTDITRIPIIIGFADILDKASLLIDYPKKKALIVLQG